MSEKVHNYHEGNLYFQDIFDTRRLANKIAERAAEPLSEEQKHMIENADMFFLATCEHRGLPTCSYKGGAPGIVTVIDDKTIAFPNYDGNGKFQSMGNVRQNNNVGLLFIDFINQSRLRIQGTMSFNTDDNLMAKYPEAQFMARVDIVEAYPNCARYIHKYELVEHSIYVPKKGKTTPVAPWQPDLMDVLPKTDPARKKKIR